MVLGKVRPLADLPIPISPNNSNA